MPKSELGNADVPVEVLARVAAHMSLRNWARRLAYVVQQGLYV